MDDTARLTPASAPAFAYADQIAALGATPKALAVSPRNPATAIAITAKAMVVLDAGNVTATVPLSFPASCISISPDGVTVAVGADDNKVIPQPLNPTPKKLKPKTPSVPNPAPPPRSVCSPWRAAASSSPAASLSATALPSPASHSRPTGRCLQLPTAAVSCCCGTPRVGRSARRTGSTTARRSRVWRGRLTAAVWPLAALIPTSSCGAWRRRIR
jgi:hypothetical protein